MAVRDLLPEVVELMVHEPAPEANVALQLALPSEMATVPVGVPYEPLTVTETV